MPGLLPDPSFFSRGLLNVNLHILFGAHLRWWTTVSPLFELVLCLLLELKQHNKRNILTKANMGAAQDTPAVEGVANRMGLRCASIRAIM